MSTYEISTARAKRIAADFNDDSHSRTLHRYSDLLDLMRKHKVDSPARRVEDLMTTLYNAEYVGPAMFVAQLCAQEARRLRETMGDIVRAHAGVQTFAEENMKGFLPPMPEETS